MRYPGGKQRAAPYIAAYINSLKPDVYIEPFCGACNIACRVVCPVKLLSDANPYLIALWRAVQDGWIPPAEVSEKMYQEVKNNKAAFPPEMVAFVGFGVSWGAKWFGGYARDKRGRRNFAKALQNGLLNKMYKKFLLPAAFCSQDYVDALVGLSELIEGSEKLVVYCDPPYANVTEKVYATPPFDHLAFWDVIRMVSGLKQTTVLVSENAAPPDFVSVLDMDIGITTGMRTNGKQERKERLFQWKQK